MRADPRTVPHRQRKLGLAIYDKKVRKELWSREFISSLDLLKGTMWKWLIYEVSSRERPAGSCSARGHTIFTSLLSALQPHSR